MTKVREVARAIAAAEGRPFWESYIPAARAAIKAMKNPTLGMGVAYFNAGGDEGLLGIGWNAALDAALAE